MLKKLAAGIASLAIAAVGVAAVAANISGAGATFPAPVYQKWAEAYQRGDRQPAELSGDRLGRRHQADRGSAPSTSAPPTSR